MTIPYDEPPLDSEARYSYRRRGGGKFDGTIKVIGISLITAFLLAFVSHQFAVDGSISNLRETQAVQAASQKFLQEQMIELKADNREMRKEMREISGKGFRGMDGFDDADKSQQR